MCNRTQDMRIFLFLLFVTILHKLVSSPFEHPHVIGQWDESLSLFLKCLFGIFHYRQKAVDTFHSRSETTRNLINQTLKDFSLSAVVAEATMAKSARSK